MADSVGVDLIVNAISKGFDKITRDVMGLGKAGGDAGKGLDAGAKSSASFGDALGQVAGLAKTGALALGVVGATMKQAFDLGEEGAKILQTRESFDSLLQSVGAAPDLLNKLRAASGNTISDMELMGSTAKLLAGANDELANALAGATPRLLEIARAASKLNPSLGDTTMMYDSLALGIKRASPMILDNLGITIKVGQANEVYAAKIGKTVDALSAEEKQIALLNAVMASGDTLIKQAGGSVDSQADSFARMETSIANATDALKAKLAPGLANAADAIAILLSGSDMIENALKQQIDHVNHTVGSYTEYRAEMGRLAQATGKIIVTQSEYNKLLKAGPAWITNIKDAIVVMTKEEFEATAATRLVSLSIKKAANEVSSFDMAMQGLDHSFQASIAQASSFDKALLGAGSVLVPAKKKVRDLNQELNTLQLTISGPLGSEIDDFNTKQAELGERADEIRKKLTEMGAVEYMTPEQTEQVDLMRAQLGGTVTEIHNLQDAIKSGDMGANKIEVAKDQIEQLKLRAGQLESNIRRLGGVPYLTPAQKKEMDEMRDELGTINEAVDANAQAHDEATKRIMFDLLQQRAAVDGLSESELAFLNETALGWGLIDQETANYVKNADKYFETLDAKSSEHLGVYRYEMALSLGLTNQLGVSIGELPSFKEITIKINQEGSLGPSASGTSGGGDDWQSSNGKKSAGANVGKATGGTFVVPPGYPNDTYMVGLTSGERVNVQTAAQQRTAGGAAGGGETNIFYITITDAAEGAHFLAQLQTRKTARFNGFMGG